jgi:tetratricopeptide (TPR) repeat protein
VEARLLRKEPRLESYFYELSHDSLAQPILDSRPWKLTRKQRAFGYGGVITLITAMVFGYWQFQAKQEAYAAQIRAQQAREAAEAVLDYLVFDLRDKLTPLGRLDIVEEVQRQVNQYYEKIGIEGQSAAVLNRCGAAYASEGNRLLAQGKLAQAQAAYQKFLAISQQNSSIESNETTCQFNVSIALNNLGDVLDAQGKLTEAQQYYQDGLG